MRAGNNPDPYDFPAEVGAEITPPVEFAIAADSRRWKVVRRMPPANSE
jgi:hypothetical protein